MGQDELATAQQLSSPNGRATAFHSTPSTDAASLVTEAAFASQRRASSSTEGRALGTQPTSPLVCRTGSLSGRAPLPAPTSSLSPQRARGTTKDAPSWAVPASPSQQDKSSTGARPEAKFYASSDGQSVGRHAAALAALEHDQRGLMHQVCEQGSENPHNVQCNRSVVGKSVRSQLSWWSGATQAPA